MRARRAAVVEEDPGAVVGADEARTGQQEREDAEVVVVGVDAAGAAEDASGAEGGVAAEARGEEEPRERRRRARAEAGDHGAPRLADEGHAGAVVLARDAAEDLKREVVGEGHQGLRRLWRLVRGGHGGGCGGRERVARRGAVAEDGGVGRCVGGAARAG